MRASVVITFSDFAAKYQEMSFLAILAEVKAWPDEVPLNQGMAVLERLVDIACDDEATPDDQKLSAARLAAECEAVCRRALYRNHDAEKLLAFEKALGATHDYITRFALFPEVAKMIVERSFRSGK
jgi:hypothetical protein